MLARHKLGILLGAAANLAEVFVCELILINNLSTHYQWRLRLIIH